MITIGTQVAKAARVAEIAERYDDVFFTVGTHPHEAASEGAADFSAMRQIAAHPKCVGIGEAGLDYHYGYAARDVAKRVFRGQIGLARELGLPLVIHARDADDDIAEILTDEMGQGRFSALLHCFTSSRELAETALGLGLSISFSGVVTFKKSEGLRAIARDVPLERILVETDAPYLAPIPHRGRRNEPAFVVSTAHVVAEALGLEPEALAAATRANTLNVFPKLRSAGGRRAVTLRLTILGCGSSAGVPRVGQGWGACDPSNPKNRRRRCSALVERFGGGEATTVLVDTSPDLREQLIEAGVKRVDGILMTHPHADHTHGIDDLRPLYQEMGRRIDVHMDEPTSLIVRRAFSYVFHTPGGSSYPAIATELRLTAGRLCRIEGPGGAIEAMPFDLDHGDIGALGFRFGSLAYTPDVKRIPAASRPFLEGLDIWIIDALRYRSHPSHFSLDDALGWIETMRPRRAILTNLHTDLDYETLRARLPAHVTPAHDGMRVEGFDA